MDARQYEVPMVKLILYPLIVIAAMTAATLGYLYHQHNLYPRFTLSSTQTGAAIACRMPSALHQVYESKDRYYSDRYFETGECKLLRSKDKLILLARENDFGREVVKVRTHKDESLWFYQSFLPPELQ
ncbi:hypothetical protein [Dongshaea marina]|uniref:hypothetical protein n=1 Tax=Dongshaea marina TaxID=2047966 RepID=UPI000D3E2C60|nr:hypothetical protein [Dongshaea marina]